jgi:hypothetical protein
MDKNDVRSDGVSRKIKLVLWWEYPLYSGFGVLILDGLVHGGIHYFHEGVVFAREYVPMLVGVVAVMVVHVIARLLRNKIRNNQPENLP